MKTKPTAIAAACILGAAVSGASAGELRAAFTSQCPTTKYPEAGTQESIGTAIALSLASSLVNTGISALKKAVNPDAKSLERRFLETGLYEVKDVSNPGEAAQPVVGRASKLACLVIAAGNFQPGDSVANGWTLPFKSRRDTPDGDTGAERRVSTALGLQGPVELSMYMEAVRVLSPDRTAVTWKPVRLYVAEFLNTSFWGGRTRGLVIETRYYKPGIDEAFFSQSFTFNEVNKSMDLGPDRLFNSNLGSWGSLPAAPAVPAVVNATRAGVAFDPFTLEVRIVETPEPYSLAKAFVDAVDQNKEAVNTKVTYAIDKDAKVEAKLTASAATLEGIENYLEAYKTVTTDCANDKMAKTDGKFDAAAEMSCRIARDKAKIAKDKASLACTSNRVDSCSTLPEIPAMPT